MMTYGWAILIIVIVAVILYSMGIFNPSSSITTTSIGFSPFTVSSTVCSQAGLSVAIIGGGLPDTATQATITKIYITSNTGTTALTKAYTLNPVTISPGKTATIVIPTVACTSANVKYSLSAKLQYSYSTPAGNVATNTTGTIAGTSSANPIVKYVPLTITSSAATPAPFQQMVIVNMNNYNSYASSNLSNIEFTYPNGTIIPSWRENGTSNSQTVLYWLKLGSFTTTTVYMDFFSTSSNILNTVNTGEAPQLSSTYAEYDDGANIFNYYQRWGGLSALPANWSSVSGTVITFNSDYTEIAPDTSTGGWYGIYLNPIPSSLSSTTTIWELYGNNYNGVNAGQYIGTSGDTPGTADGYGFGEGGTTISLIYLANAGTSAYISTGYDDTNTNKIYSMMMTSPTSLTMTINYNSIFTTTSAVSESPTYFDIAPSNNGGSKPSTGVYVYWLRTRAYPPNGVMPSVSFGSVA
jgi:hypothetical protein